jgi:radical SAM protein with 4Fe4S-binding SPASM domain
MYRLEQVAEDLQTFRDCVAANEPYKPLYVKIKLTWQCNLRCKMCNYWRQEREERLSLELLRQLAGELVELGCGKVHLSGGEPTLRPDLPDIIEAFASRGIRVNLTTNGTLLTRELAATLVDTGVRSISVSVDSPERRPHDLLRGKGAWKQTRKGLRNLQRARRKKKKTKLILRLNAVITRRNYESLAALPDFAHDVGIDRLTLIPLDDPGGRLRLNKRGIQDYNERIAPVLAEKALAHGLIDSPAQAYPFGVRKAETEYSKLGHYARGLYESQPCYAPWTHALITPRGRVYPCCMTRGMPRSLGDLAKASFRDIWTGAAYRAFRVAIHRPHLEYCHCCDDFLQENRFLHNLVTGSGRRA